MDCQIPQAGLAGRSGRDGVGVCVGVVQVIGFKHNHEVMYA